MAGRTETALLSAAVTPKSDADREKLSQGLRVLMGEDPSLDARSDPGTGEVVIAGTGELHLEIVLDRLQREFNVEANVGRPRVAYKETVTRAADGEMKYARQTGGRGLYAHVKIRLVPGERGAGYVFDNRIAAGTIPDEFIGPVEDGIREALALGVLASYPVDDVRIELYDGSYHDVDSSATAFRIAAAMAFQDAASKAEPVLLEPIMHVEVVVPAEYMDEVVANLAARRGQIQGREDRSGTQIISARVPLAEMFGYTHDLQSRTRRRASYSMHLDRYEPCPPPDADPGNPDAFVGAPRKTPPTLRSSWIALPEPDDETAD